MRSSPSRISGLSGFALALVVGCSSDGGSPGAGNAGAGGTTGTGASTSTGGAGSPSAGGQAGSGGSTGGTSASAGGAAGGGTGGSAGSGSGGKAGSSSSGGTAGSAGAAGSGGASSCTTGSAWDVTYNMDGSTFDVRGTPLGAGDQKNTATPPYSAPNQFGPGTMVIRFPDSGGAPATGTVHIMSYTMNLEFTVAGGGGSATVHNDLTQDAIAGACGADSGMYSGSTATWDSPGFAMFHTHGNITCMGSLCTLGGLPDGTAQPRDDTTVLPLNPFTFTNGVGSFTMPEVQVQKDSKSSTFMSFQGMETGRKAVCDCK